MPEYVRQPAYGNEGVVRHLSLLSEKEAHPRRLQESEVVYRVPHRNCIFAANAELPQQPKIGQVLSGGVDPSYPRASEPPARGRLEAVGDPRFYPEVSGNPLGEYVYPRSHEGHFRPQVLQSIHSFGRLLSYFVVRENSLHLIYREVFRPRSYVSPHELRVVNLPLCVEL